MSRQLSRFQAVLLGCLVLLALVLGGSALMLLNERAGWGNGSFRVVAAFHDINGVEAGTRVRLQGIDAGEIEAILPPDEPGQKVRIQLRISNKYRQLVREDAKVQIASDNLFAGKVVRILPGLSNANPVEDHGELRAEVQPDALEGVAQAATKLNTLLVAVDGAMQTFRKDGGSITSELASATKKLNSVLTKADATLETIEKGEGTLGKLVKDEKLYDELTTTLLQVKLAMSDVRSGEGTLGKLVKSNEAYAEAVSSLQDVRRMVKSVQQNSDAIKALPVVRSYVVDYNKELIRPDRTRYVKWFSEGDLFEPGKAVLTARGKTLLAGGAAWLNEQKYEGSEVLVAAFADPSAKPEFANTVSQKQSEVVLEYLRGQHQVHRTGWWWWSTRNARAISCGTVPSPVPGSEKLPPARIELIVFAPAG